ncbi:uncharacterized protein LOC105187446 isoform X2 [Harpegnathos saltator]|uniref:uncharacterized protein LOC105187446 isoform X2 n=1 Tax=Harpegnathos saltator TaxID=610380 RepID=UPI0009491D10|nr:uncharacterized protein LOC105187446 isoform X2 [Harpegnathos saltator]
MTEKITLSKNILEMKFMKRTKEKVDKQQYQEEGELYFGSQVTKRMKKESNKCEVYSEKDSSWNQAMFFVKNLSVVE